MKITKYEQSCILLETKGKKILIDPGNMTEDADLMEEINYIFITHKHSDHACAIKLGILLKNNPKVKIYSNKQVVEIMEKEGIKITEIKEGDIVELEDVKVEVVKAVHGKREDWTEDKIPKTNTGYIVDDGTTRAWHCSDTITFNNNYKANVMFVPICNNEIVMGPEEAAKFAKKAELAIPIHYDNQKYPMDPKEFAKYAKKQGTQYRILQTGDTIEVE